MIKIEFHCAYCGCKSGKVISYLGSPTPYIECDECKEPESIKIHEYRDE